MKAQRSRRTSHPLKILIAVVSTCISALSFAGPTQLITEEEARLPRAPISASRSAFFPGPEINIIYPKPGEAVKNPFRIKLEYRAKGGARVNPESIEMQYMVSPSQDISSRVVQFSTDQALEIRDAITPPGEHQFVVYVADSKGHRSRAILNLNVLK